MTIESSAFRLADRMASRIGLFRRSLAQSDLLAAAQRRTGLREFGERSFEDALAMLLRSYNEEANLSAFGRFAARWDVIRLLSNLLILHHAEASEPAILERPIRRPIFITGLPRSGTTFLHSLLAQDPTNLVPRFWQTIYPYPEPGQAGARRDARLEMVDRQLSGFARLAPDIRKVHPVDARSPQECTEITAHVFRSLRFDTPHDVPSYRRWLDHDGHLAAYRFHKRFLCHLQSDQSAGRWILKCPDHLFALDAIREVYPDARFVVLHRDPLRMLASVARLTEILRQPFTRRVDRHGIGRQVSDHWARGAEILVRSRSDGSMARAGEIHVQFRDLTADPMACVRRLYEQFDMPLEPHVAARMHAYAGARPKGGYASNAYRLEDYGLDREAELARYGRYVRCFAIEPEPA